MKSILLLPFAFLAGMATAASADAPANPQVKAQIDQGKKLYVQYCAKCHGAAGQGSKNAPPVVGKSAFPLDPRPKAKRDVPFHTAADVFGWASKHMPAKAPGSLKQEEYLAIFAFDLDANGVKLDKPLDGEAAAKIVLHP